MEKHICKVCGQSFPNERSLGAHISTHVVLSSPMEDEDKPVSRYELRDNPKKSRRFDDACPEEEREKDNVHTKRVKICSPLNSSSEMPKDELYHEKEMQSQFDRLPVKKKKRNARKVTKLSVYSAWPASSSEYHNEEVHGALCLMMLSRGTHSITDLLDKISPAEYGRKVYSCPSEDEDHQFKKPKVSSFSRSGDSEYGTYTSRKRNKSFPSYQEELINQNCDSQTVGNLPENFKSHKCSICGKTFPTGQALGGHKRSHLVARNSFAASASASISAVVISTTGSDGAHPQTA